MKKEKNEVRKTPRHVWKKRALTIALAALLLTSSGMQGFSANAAAGGESGMESGTIMDAESSQNVFGQTDENQKTTGIPKNGNMEAGNEPGGTAEGNTQGEQGNGAAAGGQGAWNGQQGEGGENNEPGENEENSGVTGENGGSGESGTLGENGSSEEGGSFGENGSSDGSGSEGNGENGTPGENDGLDGNGENAAAGEEIPGEGEAAGTGENAALSGENLKEEEKSEEENMEEEDLTNGFVFVMVPMMYGRMRKAAGDNGTVDFQVGDTVNYPEWLLDRDGQMLQTLNGSTTGFAAYSTKRFTVNGKTAYCVQSQSLTPPANSQAVAAEYMSNELLQKVLYYGYECPQDIGFFDGYKEGDNDDACYILTHIAASYAYQHDILGTNGKPLKDWAFYGCSVAGAEVVKAFIEKLNEYPVPGKWNLEITPQKGAVESVDPETGLQTSEIFELKESGNSEDNSYIDIPEADGITCWVVGEAEDKETKRIYAGQSFYFTAPASRSGIWESGKITGQYSNIWRTMIIQHTNKQDIGYAEFYEESENTLSLQVNWGTVALELEKQDADDAEKKLSGVRFGVYESESEAENGINEITILTTDRDGKAECYLPVDLQQVYIKEVEAPEGYVTDSSIKKVLLGDGESNPVVIKNKKQKISFAKLSEESTDENPVYMKDAVLEVHRKSADGTMEDEVAQTIDGTLLQWTTTEEPKEFEGIKKGTYYLVETKAPHGYVKADPVEFEVTGAADEENPIAVKMIDCKTRVSIVKMFESADGKTYEISEKNPVKFEIYKAGEDDLKVKTITLTSKDPYVIEGLPVGSYILREISAPPGFTLAKDVPFEIKEGMDGEVAITTDVTVTNRATEFKVSKVDIANVKKLLPGAELEILNADTKELAVTAYGVALSWTSGSEPWTVKGLAAGKYILHEKKAPKGYDWAGDIAFEIHADGTITSKALDESGVLLMKDKKHEDETEETTGTEETGESEEESEKESETSERWEESEAEITGTDSIDQSGGHIGVQAGDDAPIAENALLFAGAAALIAVLFTIRGKRKKS